MGMFNPGTIKGLEDLTFPLGAPTNWDADKDGECKPLPVVRLQNGFVSQWRLTLLDRLRVLIGGAVYLEVLSASHPPVCVSADRPRRTVNRQNTQDRA